MKCIRPASRRLSLASLAPRLRSAAGEIRAFLLDVVYPEEALCLSCGAAVRAGCLCDVCRAGLRREVSDPWTCRDLDGVPAFSLCPHQGVPRSLVLALKHHAAACAVRELASLLDPLPAGISFSPDTVVTWVTMPGRRRRERGVDHGRLLAEAFARQLGLRCRRLLLRRDDRSKTQASLGRHARQRNLTQAYAPATGIDFPVLLVDDVLTTGTTALRCIDALRRGGASRITVLTVTHAVSRPRKVSS